MTLEKLIQRLLRRAARQPNGCLTVECKKNYLDVVFDGRRSYAHRAIWEFHNGAIPGGMEVCHICDNTRCIEIGHLKAETHSWNMRDRDKKGRNGTLGEDSPLHKLTRVEVIEIFKLANQRLDHAFIAKCFKISKLTVRRIAKKQTWKHVLCSQEAA